MHSNWKKNLSVKKYRKALALAVMAGILAGGGTGSASAEEMEYNETFVGKATGAYEGLINEYTGNINFQNATIIDVGDKASAAIELPGYSGAISLKIVVGEDLIEGVAELQDLTLHTGANGERDSYGIRQHGMGTDFNETSIFLQAKNINIDVLSDKKAFGIHFVEPDPNAFHMAHQNVLTAKSVNINAQGKAGAEGVWVGGGYNAVINGALRAVGTDGAWGIDGGEDSSNFKTVGLHSSSKSSIGVRDEAEITVNGTGLLADGSRSKIELDKGGTITTNADSKYINYSAAVKGGSITINQAAYKGENIDNRGSSLYGNIGFIGEGGNINLNLGSGSELQGVIVRDNNTNGVLNLRLIGSDSKWVNEAYGMANGIFKGSIVDSFTGSKDAGNASYIYQRDTNDLTINDYSGHSVVVYEHTGSGIGTHDYAAGDIIIKKAAADSGIILSTGNNGVDLEDTLSVDKVLNTLASKLVYGNIAVDKNLVGKVQIAEGLTGSEASLRIEDIVFDESGRGSYGSIQKKVKFTEAITGMAEESQAYITAGVFGADIYQFQKNSEITVAGGPAVALKKATEIDAGKTTLTLIATDSKNGAFSQTIAGNTSITAGNLTLVSSHSSERAQGLFLQGGAEGKSSIKLDGNLNIILDSAPEVVGEGIGIHTSSDASLVVNGDVSVKRNTEKVAPRYGYFATSGIYAGGDRNIKKGSQVVINGNVDLEGGLYANMFGSSVTVNGGGKITADATGKIESMAITAQSGTISVNMDGEAHLAGEKSVVIGGNIVLNHGLTQQGETVKESIVNLGLNTADSVLDGVIINNVTAEGFTGTTNLVLANGAQWNNAVYGQLNYKLEEMDSTVENFAGGNTADQRGIIRQTSENEINLNNYSGHTLVIYEHQNKGDQKNDYMAGDIIIGKASENSVITISTANNGIDMNNLHLVNQVLDALASKLTYEAYVNGENNLRGQVQIADGLTGSSKSLRLKDIAFDEKTGQGTYQKPDDSVVVTHNMQLIEDNYQGSTQRDYYANNYISNGDRGYTFESNTIIDVQIDRDPYDESTHSLPRGVIAWAGGDGTLGNGNGYIDMTGHRLTLNGSAGPDFNKRPTGIFLSSDILTIKNVKGLDININNGDRSRAIMVQGFISHGAWNNGSGMAKLVIENGDTMDEAVKIRFNDCYDTQSAIFVDDNSGNAELEIKGMTDIYVGLENAVGIENFSGDAYIGGGKIISTAGESLRAVGQKGKASILVNMEKNALGEYEAVNNNRYLEIEGNIKIDYNADIAAAFTSEDSSFKGGVNILKTENTPGQVHLLFANGATWINQSNVSRDWAGSEVADLIGGKTEETRGVILQKDANNLTVDNYSGNFLVIYEHENQGTQASDYQAGAFVVKQAKEKSDILLSTDNAGIDLQDGDMVEEVLNTLAGKLIYKGYTAGERNLSGKVQIAEGLTGSSASLAVGNIAFSEADGQGSYVPEIKLEYKDAITGAASDKNAYGEVAKGNGVYEFATGSRITINNGLKADIDAQSSITVNAQGSSLNLVSEGTDTAGKRAVSIQSVKQAAVINADELNIAVNHKGEASSAAGIVANGDKSSTRAKVEVNADVKLDITSTMNSQGIYAYGNAEVKVNGDLTIKALAGEYDPLSPSNTATGIMVGDTSGGDNLVSVKGDTNIKVKGNGITVNSGTVNLDGSVSIEVEDQTNGTANALQSIAATGKGVINVNEENSAVNDISLKGNLNTKAEVSLGSNIINLKMNNRSSQWEGLAIADGEHGAINLSLANAATWINRDYSSTAALAAEGLSGVGSTLESFTGSTTKENMGAIVQKHAENLTINNYTGHTTVIYEHKNNGEATEDYIGGNVIVKHAAADSGIIISTNATSDIYLSDENQTNKVLNALAGKLVYAGYVEGEENLQAVVQIADGLTSSSMGKVVGDITFNKADGKGGFIPPEKPTIPDHQTNIDFTTTITGKADKDTEYLYGGVLQEDGSYVFQKDSNINITETLNGINVREDVVVDATDSTLNIKVDGSTINTVAAINQTSTRKAEITAGLINIRTENELSRAEGVSMMGSDTNKLTSMRINADLNINAYGNGGDGYALGIYVAGNSKLEINGNITMKGENGSWGVQNDLHSDFMQTVGIYAGPNYNIQKGSVIDINGNVDLKVKGTGVMANGGNSRVYLNKGNVIIQTDEEASTPDYAIISASGVVEVNMKDKNTAGANTVIINGNVGTDAASANENEAMKESIVNLGLANDQSKLHGVIVDNFTKSAEDMGFTGKTNLYLSNGAAWINEEYGKAPNSFEGSDVEKLVGGNSAATRGVIKQLDEYDLKINDYSGNVLVIYEHEGDGSQKDDFEAGNTIINKAAKGSGIVMSTDNSGIDLEDEAAVAKVLNNLAAKLIYTSHAENTNLTGQVQIADGLTGSSISKQYGEIKFDAEGQGQLVEGSVKPGENNEGGSEGGNEGGSEGGSEGGNIDIGSYENNIMKGTRSAMMHSALAWRDVASDFTNRTSELRAGLENGAWARIYGGKTKYDGAQTNFEGSYGAVQFGYDQEVGRNWNAGIAVDYQDGEADYLMGGDGDTKLYSIGAYASRNLGAMGYVDFSTKLGRVENDFTVSNGLGLNADGEYVAESYSFSAQYGKRFGNEARGYVEPQLQLTWARVSGDSYTVAASNNEQMQVVQNSVESLVGRLAVQAGKANARGGMFVRLGLAHEFMGDFDGSYNAKDGGLKSTSFDLGDTWSELSLGLNYSLNDNSNLYADLTRGLSGDYKQEWKANLGYRFTF